jgi:hypothetical protein
MGLLLRKVGGSVLDRFENIYQIDIRLVSLV